MLIHQYIKRGINHPDYCEDFLIIEDNQDYSLFGVFDGCSSGTDSHFASALIGKTIRAEFLKSKLKNTSKTEKLIKQLIFKSFLQLKKRRDDLLIDADEELLSTMLLFLFNKTKNKGVIVVAGDGVLSVNGKIIIIDQKNMPDYPAYYLDEVVDEKSFNEWYQNHSKQYFVNELSDVSISTDGVLSFLSAAGEPEEIKPEEYLLKDIFLLNNRAMLGRKVNILKNKYNLQNLDDLGVIRITQKV